MLELARSELSLPPSLTHLLPFLSDVSRESLFLRFSVQSIYTYASCMDTDTKDAHM